MAAALELPAPLDEVLRVHHVQVVQAIDAGALAATLKFLVDRVSALSSAAASPATSPGDQQQAEAQAEDRPRERERQIRDLEAQNEQLIDRIKRLEDKQARLSAGPNRVVHVDSRSARARASARAESMLLLLHVSRRLSCRRSSRRRRPSATCPGSAPLLAAPGLRPKTTQQ